VSATHGDTYTAVPGTLATPISKIIAEGEYPTPLGGTQFNPVTTTRGIIIK
jgi:hypothetical protein